MDGSPRCTAAPGAFPRAALIAGTAPRRSPIRSIRQAQDRDPCWAAVDLHWRVSHATSHGDILDAVQHVSDDAATDWLAQILLQQDISVARVEREQVPFCVASEKMTARSRSNGREHVHIGVVLPQHVAAVGVDGSDMAEPLRVMVAKYGHCTGEGLGRIIREGLGRGELNG